MSARDAFVGPYCGTSPHESYAVSPKGKIFFSAHLALYVYDTLFNTLSNVVQICESQQSLVIYLNISRLEN